MCFSFSPSPGWGVALPHFLICFSGPLFRPLVPRVRDNVCLWCNGGGRWALCSLSTLCCLQPHICSTLISRDASNVFHGVCFFFFFPLIKSMAVSSVVPDYVIFLPCRTSNPLWTHDVWAPAEVGPQETRSKVFLAPRGLAHRKQWTRWAFLSYKFVKTFTAAFSSTLSSVMVGRQMQTFMPKKFLFFTLYYYMVPVKGLDTSAHL